MGEEDRQMDTGMAGGWMNEWRWLGQWWKMDRGMDRWMDGLAIVGEGQR